MSEIREMNRNFMSQMDFLTNSLVNLSNALTNSLSRPQQVYQQHPTTQHMPNNLGLSFREQLGYDCPGDILQSSNQ